MTPTFFKTPVEFRRWLKKNHKTASVLLVGFYKVGSGHASITWPESVDEALSFGWIDGVRKSIDETSYTIRFSPRKSTSIWSAVNIKKAEQLISTGMMQPAGLEIYKKRTAERSKIYAFENEIQKLSPQYEKKFRANKKAWKFFTTQAPYYQKIMLHRIMNAKQETTRVSRLEAVIKASAEEKRIP